MPLHKEAQNTGSKQTTKGTQKGTLGFPGKTLVVVVEQLRLYWGSCELGHGLTATVASAIGDP
jgi:hypothetical protein